MRFLPFKYSIIFVHVSLEANIKTGLFQLWKITNITTLYIKWLEYKDLCVRIYVIVLNTRWFYALLEEKSFFYACKIIHKT